MASPTPIREHDFSHEDSPSSIKNTEDSVLHRKKELKGLPSSFSSNLGRTSGSTTKTEGGRSVKSIVAWFESPNNTDASSRHSREEGKPDLSIGTISSTGSHSSLLSQRTLHGAVDVEEYSLTLLKYKQYFTERPLGRCLDGQNTSASPFDLDSKQVSWLRDFEDYEASLDTCSTPDQQQEGNSELPESESSHEARVVVEGYPSAKTAAENTDADASDEFPLIHRDPGEVLAF